jgi:hypothetical protein
MMWKQGIARIVRPSGRWSKGGEGKRGGKWGGCVFWRDRGAGWPALQILMIRNCSNNFLLSLCKKSLFCSKHKEKCKNF